MAPAETGDLKERLRLSGTPCQVRIAHATTLTFITPYALRLTLYVLRLTFYVLRFAFCVLRFTFHVPAPPCTACRTRMAGRTAAGLIAGSRPSRTASRNSRSWS